MRKFLITGGAGFIGSNFIKYVLKTYNDISIVNLDKLTYAGNVNNLSEVNNPNYKFYKGDVNNFDLVNHIFEAEGIEYVINFAAESHVDRSIMDSYNFYYSNVMGTNNLLSISRKFGVKRFLQISTDEVYGSLGDTGAFCETSPIKPNSPYSASKAAADLLCLAFHRTHDFPVVITRSSNNYGPNQFPEKLIPLTIIKSIREKSIPVFGNGLNVRDWIYVEDNCEALMQVFEKGRIGEVYNIGSENEKKNIEIVTFILNELNKDIGLISYLRDRPGHDLRYALTIDKIKNELGWEPKHSYESAMKNTIKWYAENENWWKDMTLPF